MDDHDGDPAVVPEDDEPAWTLHEGTLRVVPDPDKKGSFFFRLENEAGEWDLDLEDHIFIPDEAFAWDGRRVKVLSGIMALAMEGEGKPTGERIMQALCIELDEGQT